MPAYYLQVVQELTYLAVWLRVPLVHPQALEPPLGNNDFMDFGPGTVAKGEVQGGPKGKRGDKPEVCSVEDPWETWNTVRILCEHKSW